MSIAVAHTEEDHGHHHKETFVTKYISVKTKMISKQYLITFIHGNYWYSNVPLFVCNSMARTTIWYF